MIPYTLHSESTLLGGAAVAVRPMPAARGGRISNAAAMMREARIGICGETDGPRVRRLVPREARLMGWLHI